MAATVTVLFTDLVGSTALLSAIGDTAFDEVRRSHFDGLRRALVAHAGTEVKNTGDGIMATFPAASDAVACAAAMQHAAGRHDVAIRVGIAVGEATEEHGDWFGTPVVEAARLCAAADSGQVLVTALVRALATRSDMTFEAAGPLELKGLPEPVDAYAIAWRDANGGGPQLPGPLVVAAGDPFVGRASDLAVLRGLWKAVAAGDAATVLIGGEPGIGKTRLLAELARHAQSDGAIVLFGRCDEESSYAYQPMVEAIRQVLGALTDGDLARHAERCGGDLCRIAPDLRRRMPDLPPAMAADAETERALLFEASADLLRTATDAGPVLLVLDDLQWADASTLQMVRHVQRSVLGWPVLIAGTYRDTDLDRSHPLAGLLADLRRDPSVHRVALSGLAEVDVARYLDLVADAADAPGAEPLIAALAQQTEGNPFFLREVLRHLVDSGSVYRQAGRWAYEGSIEHLGIPEGVKEVVGRRLSRLPEGSDTVLHAAAVIGATFDINVLEQVAGSDPLDILDAAAQARLVVEVGDGRSYRFAHALVRQTLEEELSSARRARLHSAIADAIESGVAGRAEDHVQALAHHACEGARLGDADRASRYALLAARQAAERLAHEEVVAWAERGLDVLELVGSRDPLRLAELHNMAALALVVTSNRDGVRRHGMLALEAARAAGSGKQLTDAVRALARAAMFGHREQAVIDACHEALELLSDDDHAARCRVVAALAELEPYRPLMSQRVALAVDLAHLAGDAASRADSLFARYNALIGTPDLERMRAVVADMRSFADSGPVRNELWHGHATHLELNAAFLAGDLELVDRLATELATIADRLRNPFFGPGAIYAKAALAVVAGRFADAEAMAAGGLELDDTPDVTNAYAIVLVSARYEQGRLGELVDLLVDGVAANPGIVAYRVGVALAQLQAGERDAARSSYRAVAADSFDALLDDVTYPIQLAFSAELCAAFADAAGAAELRSRLEPFAGRCIVLGNACGSYGAADRYLGMLETVLGDGESAERRFADALALEASMPSAALAARTRFWWARSLAPSDARREPMLDVALATARALGQQALLRDIEALRGEVPGSS